MLLPMRLKVFILIFLMPEQLVCQYYQPNQKKKYRNAVDAMHEVY